MTDWQPYPYNRPTESKTYLLSVERHSKIGSFAFNYIGYYNAETQTWHKYDGFADETVKEPIRDRVTGWITDLSVFL